MVGRAALGNPYIFARLKARIAGEPEPQEPAAAERAALALRYAEAVCARGYSGADAGDLTRAKTQIMRFLKNARGFKKLRVGLKNVGTLDELKELLCEYV